MFTLLITFMRCFHVSEPDARFPRRGNSGSRAVAGRTLLRNTGKRSHKWHDVYLIMWRPLTKLLPNTFPTIILKSGLKKQKTETLSGSLYNVKCTAFPGFCCAASKILLCSVKSLLVAQPRSTRLPSFKVQMKRGKNISRQNISRWQTENYVFSSSWLEVRIRSLVTSFFTALRAIESSCCCCGIVNIADLYQ